MLLRLLLLAPLLGLLAMTPARAGSATTRDSLDRLEEILRVQVEEGLLVPGELMPAILVAATPRTEETLEWFPTRAIEVLQRSFGNDGLRLCEACMVPRTWVEPGGLVYQTGPLGLDEVIRLDEQSRGSAQPARTAIWMEEHRGGVAIRIVDLATGQVRLAMNVDPTLTEKTNTRRMFTLSEELDRRARGESITQAFVDIAIFPGQHISLDWTEQWGRRNQNLSGVSLSVLDPVVGIGGAHYHAIKPLNSLVGGKVLVSLPTAVVQSLGDGGEVLDPLLTVVGILRVPFGRSNYGGVLSVSTNGELGIGISLMNISLIPVIP